MVLLPESAFFRYFGSDGELPEASTEFATPLPPASVPEIGTGSDQPALDGLGIEEVVPPSMTLEDGSQLEPTVGTEAPAPVEDAAPLPAPAQ